MRTHSNTPLLAAVKNNAPRIASLLLEAGADENDMVYKNLRTVLIEAVRECPACVPILLEHGAKTFLPDYTGATALHWALARGTEEEVRQLILANANPFLLGSDGNNAFEVAKMTDSEDRIPVLRRWRAKPK